MSEASIIQQLTLNQTTTFTTPTGIDRVKIHNDSSYYLRVYFGLGAPGTANAGGWHDTISPGASPVIAVVGAAKARQGLDLTNSLNTGTYQGQIVVLPFLPVGVPTPNGVLTGASLCYVTGYYPEEYAETAGQVEAFIQAAKQARYQSVLGASARQVATIDQGTANGAHIGAGIRLQAATMPNLFTSNAGHASSSVNAYVYGVSVFPMASPNGLAGAFDGFLSLDIQDATFSVVRVTAEIFRYAFVVQQFPFSGPAYPSVINMPGVAPYFVQLGLGQNQLVDGDVVTLSHHITTQSGNYRAHVNAYFAIDTVNQTPLFAFPFPANPTWRIDNPQTY